MEAYNWTHFSILTHVVQCACECVRVMWSHYIDATIRAHRHVPISRICKCLCVWLYVGWCEVCASAIFFLSTAAAAVAAAAAVVVVLMCVAQRICTVCTSFMRLFFRLISFIRDRTSACERTHIIIYCNKLSVADMVVNFTVYFHLLILLVGADVDENTNGQRIRAFHHCQDSFNVWLNAFILFLFLFIKRKAGHFLTLVKVWVHSHFHCINLSFWCKKRTAPNSNNFHYCSSTICKISKEEQKLNRDKMKCYNKQRHEIPHK